MINPFTTNLKRITLLLTLTCAFVTQINAQQDRTLLYRISGNGLSKPSYLWGTIHLQDKRVFNFPDSLFRSLEQADAFAMEVHPDSLSASMMQLFMDKKNEKGDKLSSIFRPAELKLLKSKYQRFIDDPIEEITLTRLYELRKEEMYAGVGKDKMDAFMDMYLYGLASGMAKSIYGLEKAEDQLALLESEINNMDAKEFIATINRSWSKEFEALVSHYNSRDLAGIQKMSESMPTEVETNLILSRNLVMLESMELLMKNQSLFTAVGALHLPGPNGLLQLLQDRGYEVTPVFGKNQLHASKYSPPVKQEATLWTLLEVPENGFQIEMPGKAAVTAVSENKLPMYSYLDWKTTTFYYALPIGASNAVGSEKVDSALQGMLNNAMKESDGKSASSLRQFKVGNLNAAERSFASKNSFTRMQVLGNGVDFFLLAITSQKEKELESASATRFFSSFKQIGKSALTWQPYEDQEELFSISFPGKPQLTQNGGNEEEQNETESKSQYLKSLYLRSNQDGSEYMVTFSRCKSNYELTADSTTLNEIESALIKQKASLQSSEYTKGNGYSLRKVKGQIADTHQFEMLTILRGNRIYNVWYSSAILQYQQSRADSFLQSFHLLPYPVSETRIRSIDSIQFAVLSDAKEHLPHFGEDSSTILAYYPNIAATFVVASSEIKPYTWASSDNVLLAWWSKTEYESDYSDKVVVSTNMLNQNGYPAIEVIARYKHSHQFVRNRYIKVGNRKYTLHLSADSMAVTSPLANKVFESLRIDRTHGSLDITKNSAIGYLQHIKQSDNVDTLQQLLYDFADMPFTRNDLLLLMKEGSTVWKGDTLGYPSYERAIWDKVEKLTDSTDLSALLNTYHQADSNGTAQTRILEILIDLDDAASALAVPDLLPLSRQKEFKLVDAFSTLVAKPDRMLPMLQHWYRLLDDPDYGCGILYLTKFIPEEGTANHTVPNDFDKRVILLANKLVQKWEKEKINADYFFTSLVDTLGDMQSEAARAVLKKLAALPWSKNDTYYLQQLTKQLLKNELPADAFIEKLCSDPRWRTSAYNMLEETGKLHKYPLRFASQPYMAEALVYDQEDDYAIDTVIAAGSRELIFKGKPYRFYLFKAAIKEDSITQYYPAVAGPFSIDKKIYALALKDVYLSTLSMEPYDPKRIDSWLKEWLKEMEADQTDEE